MRTQSKTNLLLMCLFSCLGGIVSQPIVGMIANAAIAQSDGTAKPNSDDFRKGFRDQNGRTRLDLGTLHGQPVENLWGEDGKLRMQLGTYDGSVTGDEKGLPAMTFYDNEGRLKMLLRVAAGKNQSPVLIMKDNQQRDRIVMGLALDDKNEEPFLVYFDNHGGKHPVFGAF